MPSLRRKTKPTGKNTPAKGGKPARTKPSRGERVRQIKLAFTLTKEKDPRLVLVLIAAFLVPLAFFIGLGILLGHPIYLGVLGLLTGVLALVAVFGRRMQKMQFASVEGQPGAAAAVLQTMRGNWRITPAVQFNREQDLVHRVLGLPGVILVGEGNPGRTRGLIGVEKKKLSRFIGDTPVYDVMVGDGEGQVALKALQRHLMKLPRNIKPARVNELDRRFTALPTGLPIPKGAMPTRVPRGKMR